MFVRGSCNELSYFSFYFFGSPLSPLIRLFRVPLLARSIFFFFIFSFNHYTDVYARSSFTCSVRTFCFTRLATLVNVVLLTPARWNIIITLVQYSSLSSAGTRAPYTCTHTHTHTHTPAETRKENATLFQNKKERSH